MSGDRLKFYGFCFVFMGIVLFCVFMGGYTSFWRSENRIEEAKSFLTDACQARLDLLPELNKMIKENKVPLHGLNIDQTAKKAQAILQYVVLQKAPLEDDLAKKFKISQAKLTFQLKDLFTQLEDPSHKSFSKKMAPLRQRFNAAQDNLFITKKSYNDQISYFNERAIAFPTSLFAKLFGFNKIKYIEISKDLFLPAGKTFAPQTS
ncbi:LemA family protein [Desulfobacula sp.]